ncbi:MAG: 4Fe-4S dicluster domain-containing protein, partial [Myxococcales bacterium]|nr:4Fe-4S dicluster domain-containing protein [Myxococcales bacterium]
PEELKRFAEEERPGGFVNDLLSPKALVSRRSFVQGSSIAALAAGLQGCIRRPEDKIFPYSKAPENLIPGVPSHFATVTARGRDALGVVVTSHDGRPTKVEGNEAHPASLGGTDVRAQAYVWDLYDPDRSQQPARRRGKALLHATYDEADKFLKDLIEKHEADKGAGLRFLAPISNSPSFRRMQEKVLDKFPEARFHTYSPIDDDNAREGARIAFGEPVAPLLDYTRASVVVSLGADFLGNEPGAVVAARRLAVTRRAISPETTLSRLYVVESNYSITGGMADHRLRIPQRDIERFARALAAELATMGVAGIPGNQPSYPDMDGIDRKWLTALAEDLVKNFRRSIIVAGSGQPPRVHALVHAINAALGNVGVGVMYTAPADVDAEACRESIRQLAKDGAKMATLIMLGGNPVYDAPADLKFADLLAREGLTSVHVSTHRDETSGDCSWHIPLAHELEAWGDQASFEGVLSVQQPLIAPLYGARSEIELLAIVAGEKTTRGHDIVRETVESTVDSVARRIGMAVFVKTKASQWQGGLHKGVVFQGLMHPLLRKGFLGTAARQVNLDAIAKALEEIPKHADLGTGNIEVCFEPDFALHDGRHANNLWALELPRPMTKLVWDNAALMSPSTRDALGLKNGQMIRLSKGGNSVEIPVWAVPGHADFCMTLSLGWGRTSAGRYGNGKGFDVYPLRTSDAMDFTDGVTVEPLRETYNLVQTQTHDRMEGRPIAIDATLDEYKKEPDFASYRSVDPVSTPPLWKQQDYGEGHQWGMVIDLSTCTGCNACVVACQAENNIPVVGKFEVERGREMHWLRIDRYFVGDDENDPQVAVQPVTCQHCEEAPCENVCPVNATVHSPEGLNDMVYNRCVGTRYCANNCPYKVRRFNYLDYHGHLDDKFAWYGDFPESRKLQFNPNVTVRMRGVMEKCTYCVQRIQAGKIAAKRIGRELKDGDIRTACQSACPPQAIIFGDLNDPTSAVAQFANLDRGYKLLSEI